MSVNKTENDYNIFILKTILMIQRHFNISAISEI